MKIVLYVSDHCPFCNEVIQYFEEKGVYAEQVNVTYDQDRFDEMVELGGIATPFIRIGEQVFHSFDRTKIESLMEVN